MKLRLPNPLFKSPKYDENSDEDCLRIWVTKEKPLYVYSAIRYCLREGLEAVVFVAGAGVTTVNSKATSFPLPVVCGLICLGY